MIFFFFFKTFSPLNMSTGSNNDAIVFSYNFVADSFNILVRRLEHKSEKWKTKKGLIKGRIIMHLSKLMLIFELSINRIF